MWPASKQPVIAKSEPASSARINFLITYLHCGLEAKALHLTLFPSPTRSASRTLNRGYYTTVDVAVVEDGVAVQRYSGLVSGSGIEYDPS